ncbi:MAG TPA: CBS domain-containing protein [Gemmatimonadales bacterium]
MLPGVPEAVRAIESNNIGAVVVQDRGRVAGIATDRDLTIRVVGQGLDPKTTTLAEVMTTTVVTLSPDDTQADAIRLMQQRRVRRDPPLVEGERLVGMVTLDDLLLDEGAPLEDLATIVQAQLGEGGACRTAPGDRWSHDHRERQHRSNGGSTAPASRGGIVIGFSSERYAQFLTSCRHTTVVEA